MGSRHQTYNDEDTIAGLDDDMSGAYQPPRNNGGNYKDNRRNQPQRPGGKPQQPPRPAKPLSHEERFTFNSNQLHVIGLLVLAAWLSDEGLRSQYLDKLKRTTGNNQDYLSNLLEKLIEATEGGFMLAPPPPLLNVELLRRFLNNRALDPQQVARLNGLFVTRYFNLDEPCGDIIQRMLMDEGMIAPNAALQPRNIEAELRENAMTVKDILSIESVVRSEINDTVAGHAVAFSTEPKWAAFLDEIVFDKFMLVEKQGITEWNYAGKRIRVSTRTIKTWRNGDSTVRYDIVPME